MYSTLVNKKKLESLINHHQTPYLSVKPII